MTTGSVGTTVQMWQGEIPKNRRAAWRQFVDRAGLPGSHCNPRWLEALGEAFGYDTYALEANRDGRVVGVLPLMLVKSLLFGRFLVSLPFASWAGVVAEDKEAAGALIDRAVQLADELEVRYLELRQEVECEHPALTQRMTSKVNMRLALPSSCEPVWKKFFEPIPSSRPAAKPGSSRLIETGLPRYSAIESGP